MHGAADGGGGSRQAVAHARAALAAGDHAGAFAALRAAVRPGDDFTDQARVARAFAKVDAAGLGLRPLKLAILAGSTVDHLAEVLRFWLAASGFAAEIHVAPYDTVAQTVLDPGSELYAFRPQVVWLFSTHRDVAVAAGPGATAAAVEAAVDAAVAERTALWRVLAGRLDALVLQNNADIPADDPFGNLAGATAWGSRTALRLYNARLAAAAPAGVAVFDLDHVSSLWGRARWTDPRYWHHSKHAFAPDATGSVAAAASRLLAGAMGLARKCLVLDLDNTLWGGVVGDDGVAGIALGSGADGEAFVAFQRHVKALKERGVILAVVSKNEEAAARAPFESHPDMVLRLDDIAVFRANWTNKADNIQDVAETLSIGLESLVLVDDNPAERDLVRRALPMVEVVEMPEDPAHYVEALARAGCFEAVAFSAEDGQRARYYADNARRVELSRSAVDMDGYLVSLGMTATVGGVDEFHLPRIAQLINKSNQFHLTGTRLTEREVERLAAREDTDVVRVHLADRFGDNGLIAVLVLRRDGDALHVDCWAMSCRVLGRTVEEFIANETLARARRRGCATIVGRYVKSPKNALVAGLYDRLGFVPLDGDDDERRWSFEVADRPDGWKTHVREAEA
ncbi:MAG: HAD-IIIC family phosphatase [Thalassobaculum sp.]|uniref:HAD-IIIC family phosphatase n=1 Tax=Thalassobaculum sp. TaxID=2022740 RepID=UPI0032EBB2AD